MLENQSGTSLCEHQVYGAFNLRAVLQRAADESLIEHNGKIVSIRLSDFACRLAHDVGARRQYAHTPAKLNPITMARLRRHYVGAFGELGFVVGRSKRSRCGSLRSSNHFTKAREPCSSVGQRERSK